MHKELPTRNSSTILDHEEPGTTHPRGQLPVSSMCPEEGRLSSQGQVSTAKAGSPCWHLGTLSYQIGCGLAPERAELLGDTSQAPELVVFQTPTSGQWWTRNQHNAKHIIRITQG